MSSPPRTRLQDFACHPRYRILLAFIGGLAALTAGCQTYTQRLVKLRTSYHQGDLATASEESERLLAKNRRNANLIRLDQSLVRLAEGRPEETENLLRQVRDDFSAETPLLDVGQVTTWLLDDQSRKFQPDDYEQLFVLIYLALANLVQDGDDAYAYANQITSYQAEIEQRIQGQLEKIQAMRDQESNQRDQATRPSSPVAASGGTPNGSPPSPTATPLPAPPPTIAFKQIPLAPLIAGLLHEQTHRDYDTAERYYRQTLSFAPGLGLAERGLHRCLHGRHSEKGNGVLYVFTAIGKGPRKVERAEIPTSQAMLIADRILSAIGDHTLPPTIAPIKTARVMVPQNAIQTVRVAVNQVPAGETETVADLGQIALQQDLAKQDLEIARAIVRRIVKKSAIYASKNALGTASNSWADLLINVAGVAWEATESADTRCWGLLPEKVQVLRIELPVGTHVVNLTPAGVASPITDSTRVEIRDGVNTYLFAHLPNDRVAGEILVSGR